VLILGSLPGRLRWPRGNITRSRARFWPLMGRLFGGRRRASLRDRLRRLTERRRAVGVCASARRPGSLDTKIEAMSVAPKISVDSFKRIGHWPDLL